MAALCTNDRALIGQAGNLNIQAVTVQVQTIVGHLVTFGSFWSLNGQSGFKPSQISSG